MKYRYTNLLAAGTLCLVLCCASCRYRQNDPREQEESTDTLRKEATEKEADGKLSFSTYREKKQVHIDRNPRYPYCDIELDMTYPSGFYDKERLKEIQDLFLANTLGESYTGQQPEQAAKAYVKNYIEDYQNEMQGYIDELTTKGETFDPKDETWMNYTLSVITNTLFEKQSIWSYGCQIYTYTGGAHGMSGTVYQSIDMEKARPILLNDIFAEKESARLTALLKRELMRKEEVTTEEELAEKGYWPENLSPTENFYVSQKGITWLYNPYEIAPYAFGAIRITLSYDQISLYILPNSPVRRLFE